MLYAWPFHTQAGRLVTELLGLDNHQRAGYLNGLVRRDAPLAAAVGSELAHILRRNVDYAGTQPAEDQDESHGFV